MPWLKQLDFFVRLSGQAIGAAAAVGEAASFPNLKHGKLAASPTIPAARGRDPALEGKARELLHSLGLSALALLVRVEWSARMRTAAGRADYGRKLISLNPRLREHGEAEVDRTLRHELAHLIAHTRARRRRIQPHGKEWRRACDDLGIGGEARCHTLPFPVTRRARPFLYRCPRCRRDFPRTRRIRRAMACLACCRRFNRGQFAKEFQLEVVRGTPPH